MALPTDAAPAPASAAQVDLGQALPGHSTPPQPIVYDGKAGPLGFIALKNMVLNLLTLGIYRFWAKTRLRHHFWEHFSFAGDRFEYLGTGRELFLGFLIVLLIIVPLIVIDSMITLFAKPAMDPYGLLLDIPKLVFILFLIGVATYRARGYRLTRTAWRGVRGVQTGRARSYALRFLGYAFLVAVTFGLAVPLMNLRMERYRLNNTWFGDRSFSFDGRARDLFWRWLLYWFLIFPTMGASLLWYRAREIRYIAAKTRLGDLRFESSVRGRHLFFPYLAFFAVFGVLFALVMPTAAPFMEKLEQKTQSGQVEIETIAIVVVVVIAFSAVFGVVRLVVLDQPLLRATFGRLSAIGEFDFATLKQSSATYPSRGEGLASAFDLGDF